MAQRGVAGAFRTYSHGGFFDRSEFVVECFVKRVHLQCLSFFDKRLHTGGWKSHCDGSRSHNFYRWWRPRVFDAVLCRHCGKQRGRVGSEHDTRQIASLSCRIPATAQTA